MKALFAKGFGVSGLAALVMFAAVDADAAVRSFAATECVTGPGSAAHAINQGQVWNPNPVGTDVTDYCPVVSDTNINARFATRIDVNGWSTGSGSISVTACRASISGGNAVCAVPATTSTVTNAAQNLNVAPSIGGVGWGTGNDQDGFYLIIKYRSSAAIFNYSFTT